MESFLTGREVQEEVVQEGEVQVGHVVVGVVVAADTHQMMTGIVTDAVVEVGAVAGPEGDQGGRELVEVIG